MCTDGLLMQRGLVELQEAKNKMIATVIKGKMAAFIILNLENKSSYLGNVIESDFINTGKWSLLSVYK